MNLILSQTLIGRIMALNMLPGDVHEGEEINQNTAKTMETDSLSQETIRKHWEKMKMDLDGKSGKAAQMMSGYNTGSGAYFTSTQSWDVKQGSS